DPARAVAPDRPRRADGRPAGPGGSPGPRPVRPGRGGPPGPGAPERRALARRPAVGPHDGRAVDAAEPGPRRRRPATGITGPAGALRILTVADVSPREIVGGGERVLWETASRLAARHRVRILSRAPDGAPAGALERAGVPIQQYAVDRRSPLRLLRASIVE